MRWAFVIKRFSHDFAFGMGKAFGCIYIILFWGMICVCSVRTFILILESIFIL